jgi:hypothetical protein
MNRRRLTPKATKSAPAHIDKFSAVVGASWLLSRRERDLKSATSASSDIRAQRALKNR